MDATPGNPGTAPARRRWARAAITLAATGPLALIAAAIYTGCTVNESNYATLSFFFDGVPNPGDVRGPNGEVLAPGDIRRRSSVTIHKPYAEDNCDACHQGRMRMSRRDSDVCMKCHEAERSKHERMHGPVASGECLWCHSPHESAFGALLRERDRTVCTTCHTAGLLDTRTVPAHSDQARGCLECHYGHGGSAPHMLRDGVLPLPAPTAPAPEKVTGDGAAPPATPQGGR